ncbi:MAG: hypothetical protein AB8B81_11135 [Halioglobus sp.]
MTSATTRPKSTRSPVKPNRLVLTVLSGLMLSILSACNIDIVVPAGGKVVSKNGVVCLSGSTCTIEVTDETFDDTFEAIPDPGYKFKHWQKGTDHFCGKNKKACRLFTTAFDSHPAILDVLASDKTYLLKPVFVNKSGYKVSYWKKTLSEIDQGSFSSNSALYQNLPNVQQCDPGTQSQTAADRALKALNEIRAMHKLPAVEYDDFYDSEVQEAALVQRARGALSHNPESSDPCFTASALSGSETSNLGGASAPTDPASDIVGWTNDNFNGAALAEAGHRRWVLAPELGYTTYGQVEGFTALKVFGFGMPPQKKISSSVEYIAFPYKSYPWVLVSKGNNPTPWSLSMVPPAGMSNSSFDYFSRATVSVRDTDSGEDLSISSLHNDTKRFGLANFLSWQVDNWEYDTEYRVTVRDINLPGGGTRQVSYSVLLDRFNLVEIAMPLESGDSSQVNSLQGQFDSPTDQDSYVVNLANSVSFRGSSNFSNQAFFIRVYDDRKRLITSSDSAFTMNFTPGMYTVLVSPCNEAGGCYEGTTNYSVTF